MSSWNVVGTIDGIQILGDGTDTNPSNSSKFGFEYIPEVPVYDFSYLGSGNSTGSIATIADNAPVSGLYTCGMVQVLQALP